MNIDIHGIILISIAALELLSGIYIFVTRTKGHIVYAHSLIVLGVVVWVFGDGMYRLTSDPAVVELWMKIFYFGATVLTIAFVYFTYAFPFFLRKLSWPIVTIFIVSAVYIGALVILTDDIARVIAPAGKIRLQYGTLHQVFMLWFHAMFFWGFANLVEKMKVTAGIYHWQVRNIFLGILLSFIFGDIFALLLPAFGGPQWFYIACESSIFWLAFVTYIMFGKPRTT